MALYRFDPDDGTIADDFYATDVMATFASGPAGEGATANNKNDIR